MSQRVGPSSQPVARASDIELSKISVASSIENLNTQNSPILDKLSLFNSRGTVKTNMTRGFYKACHSVGDPGFFQTCANILTNIGLRTPTREEVRDENVAQSLIKIASFQSLRVQYLQYCCFGKIEIINPEGHKIDATKKFFAGFCPEFAKLLKFVPVHRNQIHDRCQTKVLTERAKEVLKVIYGANSSAFQTDLVLMKTQATSLNYKMSSSFTAYINETITKFNFGSVKVKELWFDSDYEKTTEHYQSAIDLATKALKASTIQAKINEYKESNDVPTMKKAAVEYLLTPYRNLIQLYIGNPLQQQASQVIGFVDVLEFDIKYLSLIDTLNLKLSVAENIALIKKAMNENAQLPQIPDDKLETIVLYLAKLKSESASKNVKEKIKTYVINRIAYLTELLRIVNTSLLKLGISQDLKTRLEVEQRLLQEHILNLEIKQALITESPDTTQSTIEAIKIFYTQIQEIEARVDESINRVIDICVEVLDLEENIDTVVEQYLQYFFTEKFRVLTPDAFRDFKAWDEVKDSLSKVFVENGKALQDTYDAAVEKRINFAEEEVPQAIPDEAGVNPFFVIGNHRTVIANIVRDTHVRTYFATLADLKKAGHLIVKNIKPSMLPIERYVQSSGDRLKELGDYVSELSSIMGLKSLSAPALQIGANIVQRIITLNEVTVYFMDPPPNASKTLLNMWEALSKLYVLSLTKDSSFIAELHSLIQKLFPQNSGESEEIYKPRTLALHHELHKIVSQMAHYALTEDEFGLLATCKFDSAKKATAQLVELNAQKRDKTIATKEFKEKYSAILDEGRQNRAIEAKATALTARILNRVNGIESGLETFPDLLNAFVSKFKASIQTSIEEKLKIPAEKQPLIAAYNTNKTKFIALKTASLQKIKWLEEQINNCVQRGIDCVALKQQKNEIEEALAAAELLNTKYSHTFNLLNIDGMVGKIFAYIADPIAESSWFKTIFGSILPEDIYIALRNFFFGKPNPIKEAISLISKIALRPLERIDSVTDLSEALTHLETMDFNGVTAEGQQEIQTAAKYDESSKLRFATHFSDLGSCVTEMEMLLTKAKILKLDDISSEIQLELNFIGRTILEKLPEQNLVDVNLNVTESGLVNIQINAASNLYPTGPNFSCADILSLIEKVKAQTDSDFELSPTLFLLMNEDFFTEISTFTSENKSSNVIINRQIETAIVTLRAKLYQCSLDLKANIATYHKTDCANKKSPAFGQFVDFESSERHFKTFQRFLSSIKASLQISELQTLATTRSSEELNQYMAELAFFRLWQAHIEVINTAIASGEDPYLLIAEISLENKNYPRAIIPHLNEYIATYNSSIQAYKNSVDANNELVKSLNLFLEYLTTEYNAVGTIDRVSIEGIEESLTQFFDENTITLIKAQSSDPQILYALIKEKLEALLTETSRKLVSIAQNFAVTLTEIDASVPKPEVVMRTIRTAIASPIPEVGTVSAIDIDEAAAATFQFNYEENRSEGQIEEVTLVASSDDVVDDQDEDLLEVAMLARTFGQSFVPSHFAEPKPRSQSVQVAPVSSAAKDNFSQIRRRAGSVPSLSASQQVSNPHLLQVAMLARTFGQSFVPSHFAEPKPRSQSVQVAPVSSAAKDNFSQIRRTHSVPNLSASQQVSSSQLDIDIDALHKLTDQIRSSLGSKILNKATYALTSSEISTLTASLNQLPNLLNYTLNMFSTQPDTYFDKEKRKEIKKIFSIFRFFSLLFSKESGGLCKTGDITFPEVGSAGIGLQYKILFIEHRVLPTVELVHAFNWSQLPVYNNNTTKIWSQITAVVEQFLPKSFDVNEMLQCADQLSKARDPREIILIQQRASQCTGLRNHFAEWNISFYEDNFLNRYNKEQECLALYESTLKDLFEIQAQTPEAFFNAVIKYFSENLVKGNGKIKKLAFAQFSDFCTTNTKAQKSISSVIAFINQELHTPDIRLFCQASAPYLMLAHKLKKLSPIVLDPYDSTQTHQAISNIFTSLTKLVTEPRRVAVDDLLNCFRKYISEDIISTIELYELLPDETDEPNFQYITQYLSNVIALFINKTKLENKTEAIISLRTLYNEFFDNLEKRYTQGISNNTNVEVLQRFYEVLISVLHYAIKIHAFREQQASQLPRTLGQQMYAFLTRNISPMVADTSNAQRRQMLSQALNKARKMWTRMELRNSEGQTIVASPNAQQTRSHTASFEVVETFTAETVTSTATTINSDLSKAEKGIPAWNTNNCGLISALVAYHTTLANEVGAVPLSQAAIESLAASKQARLNESELVNLIKDALGLKVVTLKASAQVHRQYVQDHRADYSEAELQLVSGHTSQSHLTKANLLHLMTTLKIKSLILQSGTHFFNVNLENGKLYHVGFGSSTPSVSEIADDVDFIIESMFVVSKDEISDDVLQGAIQGIKYGAHTKLTALSDIEIAIVESEILQADLEEVSRVLLVQTVASPIVVQQPKGALALAIQKQDTQVLAEKERLAAETAVKERAAKHIELQNEVAIAAAALEGKKAILKEPRATLLAKSNRPTPLANHNAGAYNGGGARQMQVASNLLKKEIDGAKQTEAMAMAQVKSAGILLEETRLKLQNFEQENTSITSVPIRSGGSSPISIISSSDRSSRGSSTVSFSPTASTDEESDDDDIFPKFFVGAPPKVIGFKASNIMPVRAGFASSMRGEDTTFPIEIKAGGE